MPFFNFAAPGGNGILSSQFWIYWAVSIPLTIIVILLWTIWYRWSVNQHRIEDEKQSASTAIFGALDGTDDRMELEFELVRKKKRKTTPLLTFLGGGKRRTGLGDDTPSEDSLGSTKQRGFWQRLLRRRRSVSYGSTTSDSRSLAED
jgi:hypothetical protein